MNGNEPRQIQPKAINPRFAASHSQFTQFLCATAIDAISHSTPWLMLPPPHWRKTSQSAWSQHFPWKLSSGKRTSSVSNVLILRPFDGDWPMPLLIWPTWAGQAQRIPKGRLPEVGGNRGRELRLLDSHGNWVVC